MYRENSGLKEGLIVLRTVWLKIVILAPISTKIDVFTEIIESI